MSYTSRSLDRPLPPGADNRGRLPPIRALPRSELGSDSDDEELRWAAYIQHLHRRAESSPQLRTVEDIWRKAHSRHRGLRYPRTGHDEDGVYHLTWAFSDLPSVTFAVEVEPNGLVSWFFRDRAAGVTVGTEDAGAISLPDIAYAYLERFAQ
jgi:hypothetical protein